MCLLGPSRNPQGAERNGKRMGKLVKYICCCNWKRDGDDDTTMILTNVGVILSNTLVVSESNSFFCILKMGESAKEKKANQTVIALYFLSQFQWFCWMMVVGRAVIIVMGVVSKKNCLLSFFIYCKYNCEHTWYTILVLFGHILSWSGFLFPFLVLIFCCLLH